MHSAISEDLKSRALYALLELSKALSSHIDLDDLLRVIVANASSVIDADRTSIFVYDPLRDLLVNRVSQGLEGKTLEVPLGKGIAGDVGRTRKIANIADVYADERFDPSFDKRTGYRTRSVICAPVESGSGELLGVIQSVNKTTADRFDAGDESLMRAIASHVAVAFERARLTEVHLQNERLEEALKLASSIQMRMLPAAVAAPEGAGFDLRAHLRPAKEVGGDLYDFFWTEDQLHFCIGDVSGKGVGAALVMAVTKTLFRANAALQSDPAKVLTAMNARLHEETDSSMFVTAICGCLDLRTGVMRAAVAGHDRPLLFSAATGTIRDAELRIGIPLGAFGSFTYQATELTLEPEEVVLFFTDGVTEATSARDELFGMERLRQALLGCPSAEPTVIIDTILADVERFVGNAPQSDDLTMMALRFRGAEAT